MPKLNRASIEARIEGLLAKAQLLIDRLDAIDGDADLEPDGDERDGAFVERIDQTQHMYANMRLEDDEDNADVEEEQGADFMVYAIDQRRAFNAATRRWATVNID